MVTDFDTTEASTCPIQIGTLQTFYVKDVGGDDDVDGEEEDVSETNILVKKASKLFTGARIFRGP